MPSGTVALWTGFAYLLAIGCASQISEVDVRSLGEIWDKEHSSPAEPSSLSHAELKRRLRDIQEKNPAVVRLEVAGKSVLGREIFLVKIGNGSQKILFWSQMHGDEPTATSSLLDLFQFFGRHNRERWVAAILKKYTLLCVPVLNPDGAERNQRRNAQGIDINRDARLLQTPEGRLLKEIRDRYQPFLGFNLHNQNARTTVGDTGRVATIALLPVSSGTGNRPELTRRVATVLYEALSPFISGRISRYDEEYNPRAFGDNLTEWGTPVILIESGGTARGDPPNLTVKLNFVGILAALDSLAGGAIERANPAEFDSIMPNSDRPIYDLMLRGGWIFTGTGIPLFRGDVAIRREARSGSSHDSIIADLGDLDVFSAHESIDCKGKLITPGLIAWDAKRQFLSREEKKDHYLRHGFTSILATVPLVELSMNQPSQERWGKKSHLVNWGFVVAGNPASKSPETGLALAAWLAGGGRAWVLESDRTEIPAGMRSIPGWFGAKVLAAGEGKAFQMPQVLAGDPISVLPRWTSEAARQFGLRSRGSIAPEAIADLVIWTTRSALPEVDLGQCVPSQVILNGHVVDPAQADSPHYGRFLGR